MSKINTNSTPIALTIAGSDSGGGAGIQADLKTMSALGVYGASVITALTAQNTCEVRAIHDVPAAFVASQIDAVLEDLAVDAIKIGMLNQQSIIEIIAQRFKAHSLNIPIILDPVMVSKSGNLLLQIDALDALKEHLIPCATLITPNLPEAGVLLGCESPNNEDEMLAAGYKLLAMGPNGVLMKGGHLKGDVCVDILIQAEGEPKYFKSKRFHTPNTHGTGCTLSAAIAAFLAKQASLTDAVDLAHRYLAKAIQAADNLHVGNGHGPVHHFHETWPL